MRKLFSMSLLLPALLVGVKLSAQAAPAPAPVPDAMPYDIQAACQQVSGGSCNRTIRDSQVLWFTVGYQVLDWLNVSVAWINYAPLRKPDNSYRQGIVSVDYNAFTQISAGATITIDKLAGKLF